MSRQRRPALRFWILALRFPGPSPLGGFELCRSEKPVGRDLERIRYGEEDADRNVSAPALDPLNVGQMKPRVFSELLLRQVEAPAQLSDVGRNARQGFFSASG